MNDAELVMSRVWGRIIGEVRKMRDEKYTLERIGSILGVAKPTVQRWLENDAGGEKTAFIDIMRYLKALDIELKDLLYTEDDAAAASAVAAELETAAAEKQRLAFDLVEVQKELLQSQQKVIALQEKVINLERLNVDIADKARKAIMAAAAGKKAADAPAAATGPVAPAQPQGRRRLAPSCFPDLPPIHLEQGK